MSQSSQTARPVILIAVLAGLMGGAGRAQEQQGPKVDAPAAATAQPEPPEGPSGERTESFLRWMFRASGAVGVVILLLSFYLVALVIWMFLHFRRDRAMPPALMRDVGDLLASKQFDRAFARIAAHESFLARVLAPGVRKLGAGLTEAKRALELANEDVTMELEHRTTYLATIGTLGPMIGLVGTVYGMIRSFQAIAVAGASPQASQLAAGISTSLFSTLEGISLSVPAIAFYAYFRNRIARLSLEVQITAEGLLDQFAPGVRAPHPLVPGRPALPPKPDEPSSA